MIFCQIYMTLCFDMLCFHLYAWAPGLVCAPGPVCTLSPPAGALTALAVPDSSAVEAAASAALLAVRLPPPWGGGPPRGPGPPAEGPPLPQWSRGRLQRGLGRPHREGHRPRLGPGAARRGAWGARTVRATAATAAAVGPGGGGGAGTKWYPQSIIQI